MSLLRRINVTALGAAANGSTAINWIPSADRAVRILSVHATVTTDATVADRYFLLSAIYNGIRLAAASTSAAHAANTTVENVWMVGTQYVFAIGGVRSNIFPVEFIVPASGTFRFGTGAGNQPGDSISEVTVCWEFAE